MRGRRAIALLGAVVLAVTLLASASALHTSRSAAMTSTTLASNTEAGSTTVRVVSAVGFSVGQAIVIDTGNLAETVTITAVVAPARGAGSISFNAPLTHAHKVRAPVISVAKDALQATKTGPDIVDDGDEIDYVIKVTNTGGEGASPLYNVVLDDPLPDNTSNPSFPDSGHPDMSCVPVTSKGVHCTIARLDPGETAALAGSVKAATGGKAAVIPNTATATIPNTTLRGVGQVRTRVVVTDVRVSGTGPQAALVGDPVGYQFTVSNAGQDRATNVTVAVAIPSNLDSVASPTQGCTVGTGTLSCQLGTFPGGSSRAIEVDARAATAGTATVKATASTHTVDTDPSNNATQVATTISPKPADLSITKTAKPTKPKVGGRITYTLVVKNGGPGPGTPTVTDRLPAAVKIVSATSPCTVAIPVVTCALPTLASGATAAPIRIVAKVLKSGAFSNTAGVTGSSRDPSSKNNTDTVRAVGVGVTKTTPTTTQTTTTAPTTTAHTTTARTTTATTTTTTTTTKKPPKKHPPKKHPTRKHPTKKAFSGKPRLVLSPPVAPPGQVSQATGTGFPPNAHIALRWSKGLGRESVTTDAKGGFELPVLVYDFDVLGPRRLVAGPGSGSTRFRAVSAPFLVALRALQPPDFAVDIGE